MMPGLPLLATRDLEAPLAWSKGVPISGRRFLADVAAQAALLDGAAPVVALCANRYRFAVVLAAAWTRGALNLLPPNALPDTLAGLQAGWPGLALAHDGGDGAAFPGAQVRLAPCATDADADADAGDDRAAAGCGRDGADMSARTAGRQAGAGLVRIRALRASRLR